LAAMTSSLSRLLSALAFTAQWSDRPQPVQAQIGGVARAGGPCPLAYRRI
jgi:hypothetical protein